MQIPSKCFTKRKQRHETIHQNYPPMQKNALQNTINIDREHPWLCCPKTFILLTIYMQHSLSFLHTYWGDAKGLLSTGREGGWGKKQALKRAEEAGLEPHTISLKRQDNTTHTSFTSKWNTQKGLLQIATEQDKGGTERYFRSILKQIRCI